MCEPTSYQEPIMVYGPGAVLNVYQVLFNTSLEFDFRAVSDPHGQDQQGQRKPIELLSISGEDFLDHCKSHPKSAQLIKKRCVDHLEHLSQIRSRKEHLHPANYYEKYLV